MARSRGRSRGATPRGTLGTLLRTTLAQAGVVRDVIERGAREGRARLDDARRERRRDQALARLGEAVLAAVRAGELDELSQIADAADAIAELDTIDAEAAPRDAEPPWVAPRTRERFDRRGESDDGTVSSASWRPPPRPARPSPAPPREVTREPGARFQEAAPPPARRGGISFGGDDEDDLAEFMHPDDVPKRGGNSDD